MILALVLAGSLAASCSPEHPLPGDDPVLLATLENALLEAGLGDDLANQRLAVAVVDLTVDGQPQYAGINADHMMYAASLPKIAILVSVIHFVATGRLSWSPLFDHRLRKMITVSSNAFASWGVDVAGLSGIAEVMRDPGYCFYTPPHGGLWVGRAFRKTKISRRDPLFNISHGATAREAARLFALIHMGKLVSPYWSAKMLDLMAPPGHHHKFVGALGQRPGVRFLARKSGTWRQFHADSALIEHHSKRYVVVALAESWGGEDLVRRVGRAVDDVIMGGAHRR